MTASNEDAPGLGTRILILDDDAAHAKSVGDVLAAYQYPADCITDGAAALDAIASGDYQVLILDLNMPGLSGMDVLESLNRSNSRIKTIVLSGESSVDAVTPMVRLDAYDYLTKPLDPQQLLTSVVNALDRYQLERDNESMAAQVAADHELHQFLVNQSPDLIYMLDAEGDIAFLNRQPETLLGLDPQSVIGKPWPALLDRAEPELIDRLVHRFNERRTGPRATHNFEFEYTNRSGEHQIFEFSSTGLYESSRFNGTYGVMKDVTEARRLDGDRLRIEKQQQQAGKMETIGQFAGGIAHDFNNILASIIGYAELVQNSRDKLDDKQVDVYLSEVVSAGHRAKDLISQMLKFTRAKRGEPTPVDVCSVISDVYQMLRGGIHSTIDVQTRFDDNLPPVIADPLQLQQIIMNLLVNARDAISGNGTITLTVDRQTQEDTCACCGKRLEAPAVVVSVTDSGHGIDEAILGKIFELYFTTREPGKGTGYGLWLINDLVHEYGGHITVQSEPGRGTTFRTYFPSADEAPVVVTEPPRGASLSGRVVVVDDKVSIGNFCGEVLRNSGFDVVVFNDSPLAMQYLRDHANDTAVVVTDMVMPTLTGLELAEGAREIRADLPIILITGFAEDRDLARLQRIGINGFLEKPFGPDQLLHAIREVAPDAASPDP